MEKQTYIITFNEASEATASFYASELRDAILDASPEVEVDQQLSNLKTQGFGDTLVLVLGTPAIVAAATAIGDWLKLRQSASITIQNKDGKVEAVNVTSKDVLKIVEILRSK